jgi:hypothetical protein
MIHTHPNLQSDTIDAATSFIHRLQERGVRVILFTLPYHQAYNRLFNWEWQQLCGIPWRPS